MHLQGLGDAATNNFDFYRTIIDVNVFVRRLIVKSHFFKDEITSEDCDCNISEKNNIQSHHPILFQNCMYCSSNKSLYKNLTRREQVILN